MNDRRTFLGVTAAASASLLLYKLRTRAQASTRLATSQTSHEWQGSRADVANHRLSNTLYFDGSLWDRHEGVDLSAEVDADTAKAIYIAFGTNASGSSGAWIRRYKGARNYRWYGAVGDGRVDDTAAFAAAESHAGIGGLLYLPPGHYIKDRTYPASNTTIWVDPKATISGKVGGNNIWRIQDVSDVHIHANGATITRDNSGTSANIYFAGAKRCSLRNAKLVGAGANKDCVYIGKSSVPCEDVVLAGGSYAYAKRNGVSVAGGKRTTITGVEIYGTTGAPGAGIDVEANYFDDVDQTTIQHCNIHHNRTYGVVVVFGDRTKISDNEIHHNTLDGIGGDAGGTQFDDGVYRSNLDVRGVSAFDPATGRISVGGDLRDLPIGALVSFSARNGAAVPATFRSTTYWVVAAHVAGSTTDILLGSAVNYDVKTALSGSGNGRMNADPALSDIRLRCMVAGQCSNIEISGNHLHDNGGEPVRIARAVGLQIENNDMVQEGAVYGSQISYSRGVRFIKNRLDGKRGANKGVSLSSCSDVETDRNIIKDFANGGIVANRCSWLRLGADLLFNCGTNAGKIIEISACDSPRISSHAHNDDRRLSTFGIFARSNVTHALISKADLRRAGNSNANSIVGSSSSPPRIVDTIQFDGSYWGKK